RLHCDCSGGASDSPRSHGGLQRSAQRFRCECKTATHAGQPEKFAERAQHDQPRALRLRDDTAFRRHIDEGLVDDQPAAVRGQPFVPHEQLRRLGKSAERIVGVEHHQYIDDAAGEQRIDRRRLARIVEIQFVPGPAPAKRVLGVADRRHRNATRAGELRAHQRQPLDQHLRTGRDHWQCRRLCVIAGGLRQRLIVIRQMLEQLGIWRAKRIRDGIDAGRQIEPVVQRNTIAPARRCEIAAVQGRSQCNHAFTTTHIASAPSQISTARSSNRNARPISAGSTA
ncbi:conserved hypothetical protein, partial [Ricinus communis]